MRIDVVTLFIAGVARRSSAMPQPDSLHNLFVNGHDDYHARRNRDSLLSRSHHEGTQRDENHPDSNQDNIEDLSNARFRHLRRQDGEVRSQSRHEESILDRDLHASHQGHNIRKGSFEPCQGSLDVCKSMCRWLKLSTEDASFKKGVEVCPLFEGQLAACDYKFPERRSAGSPEDPLDCALNIMRSKVLETDVAATVDELDTCLQAVPESEKSNCHFAMDLMESEIKDYREEQVLRSHAQVVKKELNVAIMAAKASLKSKLRVVEAMGSLVKALQHAEEVPGHYLTGTIHIARKFLDKLGRIVPVVDELEDSQVEGRIALDTKDAFRAEQAVLRLSAAMEDAERLEISRPLEQAEKVQDNLLLLSAAEEDLNAAIIQANSSWSTVSHMGHTLERLRNAIDLCKEMGVLNRVSDGERTYQLLHDVQSAHLDISAAIDQGESSEASGEDGEGAIATLRESIEAAEAVHLHRDVDVATDVLHELMHLQAEKSRHLADNRDSGGRA